MSASLTMLGDDMGRIRSSAEARHDGAIDFDLRDDRGNYCGTVLSRDEAAKIMADLATAMGLIEAPKAAARKPLIVL